MFFSIPGGCKYYENEAYSVSWFESKYSNVVIPSDTFPGHWEWCVNSKTDYSLSRQLLNVKTITGCVWQIHPVKKQWAPFLSDGKHGTISAVKTMPGGNQSSEKLMRVFLRTVAKQVVTFKKQKEFHFTLNFQVERTAKAIDILLSSWPQQMLQ